MDIFLIACCGAKAPGGKVGYSGSVLETVMPAESYAQLQKLRRELGGLLGLAPGPDLGDSSDSESIRYLPAYQRYEGIVYCHSRLRELYPKARGIKVLIVSALYGLLDADDPIRYYDLKMGKVLPTGTSVKTWWKQHHLGALVRESLLALRPQHVHDLLSGTYRQALAPWPPMGPEQAGTTYVSYSYPGRGSISQRDRGDEVKLLLCSAGQRNQSNPGAQ